MTECSCRSQSYSENIGSFDFHGFSRFKSNLVSDNVSRGTKLYSLPDGGILFAEGNCEEQKGKIRAYGMIDEMTPIEFELVFEPSETDCKVTLRIQLPVSEELSWSYKIEEGRSLLMNYTFEARTFSAWCILKCAGAAALTICLLCLPSLVGGPAAYAACLVAAGLSEGAAAGIAICVAQKCR